MIILYYKIDYIYKNIFYSYFIKMSATESQKIDRQTDVGNLLGRILIGESPDIKGAFGKSLLLYAVEDGKIKVMLSLMKRGANPNINDDRGDTPLNRASFLQNNQAVRILLDHQANPNIANLYGWTPLHWAASAHNPEIFIMLMKAGANPNAITTCKTTPLHIAAQNLCLYALNEFLVKKVDVNAQDEDGYTPLHWAAYRGLELSVLVLLLNRGYR